MPNPQTPIVPVLLCGGAGTRLWPLSRAARPKQLARLAGEGTMLQQTALRVPPGVGFAPPIVVAGADQAEQAMAQLAQAGIEGARLIREPEGRNTAPAIALAAHAAGPQALMLVMPSDHLIADPAPLREAALAAAPLAAEDWLVTFGIRPSRAETGYGYIRRGEPLGEGAFAAAAFVEKPDGATAEAFVADGGYDWNAGIFLMRAGACLDALERHAPDIAAAAAAAFAGRSGSDAAIDPDPTAFAAAPARSIDHAVMEHSGRIALVPLDLDWSDLGSWQALWEASARDSDGNALAGDALAIGSSGCLIHSDGPLVVAVGVSDLVVVASGDAVLVVPRAEAQRVREAVAALAARRDPRL